MDEKIKAEWTKRLRSGDYMQARETLIESDLGEEGPVVEGHCCLGVLVDYAIEAGCPSIRYQDGSNRAVVEVHRPEDGGWPEDGWWMEFEDGDLPQEVADWAGINSTNPKLPSGPTLITLNDEEGLTFDEIAKVIDEEL